MCVHDNVYTYMHVKAIGKKIKEHKFDGEWREVYGRVWRKKRERRSVITIKSHKEKN